MPIFLGFDRSGYPGDNTMQQLRTTAQIDFTGFYLAPAPSHGDTGWMSKRAFERTGSGLCPVYVGQQQSPPGSLNLSTAQGKSTRKCVVLAGQAGFPAGSVIIWMLRRDLRSNKSSFCTIRHGFRQSSTMASPRGSIARTIWRASLLGQTTGPPSGYFSWPRWGAISRHRYRGLIRPIPVLPARKFYSTPRTQR